MEDSAPSSLSGEWLTRSLVLRAIGLVYAVAFLVAFNQAGPLIGEDGLLPARQYLDQLAESEGGRGAGFLADPSWFWLDPSTRMFQAASALGLLLSVAVVLGATNAGLQVVLWAIQLSLVNVGQLFWGYGWETLLCEAGFLAIFLCPWKSIRPFPADSPPPTPVIWLYRWLLFRLMFGAGLIKLRGDSCWRDLTCLAFHYETQPNPNPISFWLAHQPMAFHELGALTNHLVELIVPWFLFAPRPIRRIAGLIEALFQLFLIISGNLSFLNWLTLALCLCCFDDALVQHLVPIGLRVRLAELPNWPLPGRRSWVVWGLLILVGALSIQPTANLLSSHQLMNYSFNRLHLVNTYGAFGSVGRARGELAIEGTRDEPGPSAHWTEYSFKCKPGDVQRSPCWLSPYHLRIDWQMWFAAMSRIEEEPWLVHLVAKLLRNDPGQLGLLGADPFSGSPPKAIRILRYHYQFAAPGHPNGAWWTRSDPEVFLAPVSLDDPRLTEFLKDEGWDR